MSKIKNTGLDQYGGGLLEQQQYRTAGTVEVGMILLFLYMCITGLHVHVYCVCQCSISISDKHNKMDIRVSGCLPVCVNVMCVLCCRDIAA